MIYSNNRYTLKISYSTISFVAVTPTPTVTTPTTRKSIIVTSHSRQIIFKTIIAVKTKVNSTNGKMIPLSYHLLNIVQYL